MVLMCWHKATGFFHVHNVMLTPFYATLLRAPLLSEKGVALTRSSHIFLINWVCKNHYSSLTNVSALPAVCIKLSSDLQRTVISFTIYAF